MEQLPPALVTLRDRTALIPIDHPNVMCLARDLTKLPEGSPRMMGKDVWYYVFGDNKVWEALPLRDPLKGRDAQVCEHLISLIACSFHLWYHYRKQDYEALCWLRVALSLPAGFEDHGAGI